MSKTKKWLLTKNRSVKRSISLVAVVLLGVAVLFPLFHPSSAAAYGQVQSRSIAMSSSANGATGVTYTTTFTAATTNTGIKGMVVSFCSQDPIIDDQCGSSASSPPAAGSVPNITSTSGFSITYTGCSSSCGWTASTTFPSPTPTTTSGTCGSTSYANNTLFLTNTTGQTINSGYVVTITLPSDVTNPTTTNTTFYGRILTFTANAQTNATAADNYCPDGFSSLPTVIDAGGVALSTAAQITITSKVQEQITFCLYESAAALTAAPTTGDGGNCSGSGSTVTLGNANGILSFTGPYVDLGTHYDIQSNASHGVTIVFTGQPENIGNISTCQSSTTNCLETSTASGTGTVSGTSYTTNCTTTCSAAQFGLCTYAVSGTTANLTPTAPYNNANCSGSNLTQTAGGGTTGGASSGGTAVQFGYNVTDATSASGSTLATFPNPGSYATGDIAFLGDVSNTTTAGIYQATLTFIATGTY